MRTAADSAMLLSVVYLPWWMTLLGAAALFFLFPRYYELLVAGLLIDLLYGVPLPRFDGYAFVVSLLSVALFCILTVVKARMRV